MSDTISHLLWQKLKIQKNFNEIYCVCFLSTPVKIVFIHGTVSSSVLLMSQPSLPLSLLLPLFNFLMSTSMVILCFDTELCHLHRCCCHCHCHCHHYHHHHCFCHYYFSAEIIQLLESTIVFCKSGKQSVLPHTRASLLKIWKLPNAVSDT